MPKGKGARDASQGVAKGAPRAPEPLVPSDCDMDGLYLPLQVTRFLKSSLWRRARRDKCAGYAAVSLWCEAWQQVPASSLPDDDELLAEFAGCDPDEWQRVKAHALSNFVKCSDGRLYHRVVAEQARIAWKTRAALREAGRDGAAARWRGGGGNGGANGPAIGHEPLARPLAKPKPSDSKANGHPIAEAMATPSLGHKPGDSNPIGQGNADWIGLDGLDKTNTSVKPGGFTAANGEPSSAPTPRDVVFARGVPLLTAGGCSDRNARSLLALQCKTHGEGAVVNAIDRCANEKPVNPVSWLQAALGVTMAGAETKSERIARHNAEVVRRAEAKQGELP